MIEQQPPVSNTEPTIASPESIIKSDLYRIEYLPALSVPSGPGRVVAILSTIIVLAFTVFLGMAEYCVLLVSDCVRGVEVLNLIGHIFGPLLGAIIGFY